MNKRPGKNFSFASLSIQKKLVLIILGISSIILLSSMAVFMSSELDSLKSKMKEDLSTLADLVGKSSSGAILFYDARTARENLTALQAKPHIISAHLLEANGNILATYYRDQQDNENDFQKQAMLALLGERSQAYLEKTSQLHIIQRIILDSDNSLLGYIHIETDRDVYWQRVKEYIYTIILMILISLLITLLIAYRAQKIFTDPIVQLLNSMQLVSREQDYSYRLKSHYDDEVGELIDGFNEMLEKLEYQDQLTRNYQKELETRVEERTRQLQIARDRALAANRTKSIFLANMSHEIRTPMNAILGYSQLLQQSSLDKDQSRQIGIINKSGNHLLSLIDDILELSKIEAGSLEVVKTDFDLQELLHSVENMFKIRCSQKLLDWEMDCFTDQPVLVNGDPGKLRQVLINLISNAVKFTDQGKIRFSIEKTAENCYYFSVEDTGPGIDEHAKEQIFEAFQQGKQGELKGGTGLGLSISRQYIDLFGGQLNIEIDREQGACFYFEIELPPASDQFLAAEPLSLKNQYSLKTTKKLTALVVDDVKDNTELLGTLLEGIGFKVVSADHGREALQKIAQQLPDIVFMDIRMPVMDGVETIKHIRRLFSSAQLKCVAVSASTLQHKSEYYMAMGYDLFISKPFHFDSIFFAIKELMGEVLEERDRFGTVKERENEVVQAQIEPDAVVKLDLEDSFVDDLLQAAEYGQLTRLGELITQLRQHAVFGDAGGVAASHLEQLMNSADLDGILAYVKSMVND